MMRFDIGMDTGSRDPEQYPISGPSCHPGAFWTIGRLIEPDAWEVVCSACGRHAPETSPEVVHATAPGSENCNQE